MYGETFTHRLALFFGCLGLAALMPYGVLASGFAVALSVLPIAVLELGAGLSDRGVAKNSNRLVNAGSHLQAYGALLFLTPYGVFAVSILGNRTPYGLVSLTVATVGAVSCVVVLLRWRNVLRGRTAGASHEPSEHGGRLPNALAKLSLIGAEPLLFGGLLLLAASAGTFWLLRGVLTAAGEVLMVVGFLGSAVLLALTSSLDRWEERAPGTSLGPLQDALQTLATLGFSASFIAGGMLWTAGGWVRWPLFATGVLLLAGTILLGARRMLRRTTPYELRLSQEGLVERSRHGTVVYPWSVVLACSLGEIGGDPCVLFHIDDSDLSSWVDGRTAAQGGTRLFEERARAMKSNRQWLGVDLFAIREYLDMEPAELVDRVSDLLNQRS